MVNEPLRAPSLLSHVRIDVGVAKVARSRAIAPSRPGQRFAPGTDGRGPILG